MTGTGTQADPLYPTNWSEFLTAVQTENAYVECPANEVWDMNEIAPNGITSSIFWRAKEVRGNNLTIKNLTFQSGIGGVTSSTLIAKNLRFLNINDVNYSGPIFGRTNASGADSPFVFQSCEFTGQLSQAMLFSLINLTNDGVKSCLITFNFINTASLGDKLTLRGCRVALNGSSSASISRINAARCRFEGTMPFKSVSFYSSQSVENVIDMYVPASTTLTGEYIGFVGVINSDKALGTYDSSEFKPVTTAQLTDIAYLQSIGFPAV